MLKSPEPPGALPPPRRNGIRGWSIVLRWSHGGPGAVVDFDDDLVNQRPVCFVDSAEDGVFTFLRIDLEQVDRGEPVFANDVGDGGQWAVDGFRAQTVRSQRIDVGSKTLPASSASLSMTLRTTVSTAARSSCRRGESSRRRRNVVKGELGPAAFFATPKLKARMRAGSPYAAQLAWRRSNTRGDGSKA